MRNADLGARNGNAVVVPRSEVRLPRVSDPAVTLSRYEDELLRLVAGRLAKPRGVLPVDELIERALAVLNNAPAIDRKLRELPPAAAKLLALLGLGRLSSWRVGPLLSLLAALGHTEGVAPLLTLFEEGLLYPVLPASAPPLRSFESWLGQSGGQMAVFAPALVAQRARTIDLGLPEWPGQAAPFTASVREADGLDWLLRMAAVWQQVSVGPLRRTQQDDFFKRDLTRLRTDPLLNGPGADDLLELEDAGVLAVALAVHAGLLVDRDGALTAADLPAAWDEGLSTAVASLWAGLWQVDMWEPTRGWIGPIEGENPYPTAALLGMLLLSRLPDKQWASPEEIETWVQEHHPYWAGREFGSGWATAWLLGVAYPLKLVQAVADPNGWLVRLTEIGRWLLGVGPTPAGPAAYQQTLMVQPNFEVIVYRQGLTPGLIAGLSGFAVWKAIGPACTLELTADRVYRGLELGASLESILRLLNQHGMRPVPDGVAESLRTWSNKRERIVVYPRATLMEFANPADLEEAARRGLISVRLTDRLGLVSDESQMAYQHLRLTGNRDYASPPEQCVDVLDDGVTLAIELGRSDLLLETELKRLAEPVESSAEDGRRHFQLTRERLRSALANGYPLPVLDEWFVKRCGEPLPPAARLLATAPQHPSPRLQRAVILEMASEEITDGLMQWPQTRRLIARRLGPTAVLLDEEQIEPLREQMRELGFAGE